jgi:hypothetical protein
MAVASLHGELTKQQRQMTLAAFRRGACAGCLLAMIGREKQLAAIAACSMCEEHFCLSFLACAHCRLNNAAACRVTSH